MRGIHTPVTIIRRRIFTEIAKFAYDDKPLSYIETLPYKIIPGEVGTYRENVFRERAIVGERLRLAMGLPLRPVGEPSPIASGIEECAVPEKFFEPPLINVISFACNACPETTLEVTDNCRGCLAHPCVNVCPVNAVSMVHDKSIIDKEKCIRCGRCKDVCPYQAIVKFDRPCALACGVDAIENDELGRAKINYDKCVSCGMCIVNCPFGAIADKSQIFQLITAIKNGEEVVAALAPAFAGQFGPLATSAKIVEGIKLLGFKEVYEVAIGADMGAIEEAHHFMHKVPDEMPFLATSCCPSWSVMAKKMFPTIAHCISESLTPMVATARLIKMEYPNAKVVFIGPCSSKKLEAQRKTVKSDVSFVITFEELMGMFVAQNIEFIDMEVDEPALDDATSAGRGYAAAGGVLDAIVSCMKELYPEKEMKTDKADGLKECRKMLSIAKAGKRNGYLLEGMACPGGCIAGAGTILPIKKAQSYVKEFKEEAKKKIASENTWIQDHESLGIDLDKIWKEEI